MENPIENIDWQELLGQKVTLLEVIEETDQGAVETDLTGILHLIDAIQDYAVDVLGVSEKVVFNLGTDEEDLPDTPSIPMCWKCRDMVSHEENESNGLVKWVMTGCEGNPEIKCYKDAETMCPLQNRGGE